MKKILALLLSMLLLLTCALPAFAADIVDTNSASNNPFELELPTPATPNYFQFEYNDSYGDSLTIYMVADEAINALMRELDEDEDAFMAKYSAKGFDSSSPYFYIYMQYDISLDSPNSWHYTSSWDTERMPDAYECNPGIKIGNDRVDDFELFWLTYMEDDGGRYQVLKPATYKDSNGKWHFDTENHSLYIRCRYFMQWRDSDNNMHYQTSEWSDSAVFGKNSTQIIPDEPTVYAAPVISGLKIVPPAENEEKAHLTYVQTTPDETWLAGIYYIMTGEGDFDGLETQVSINGGDWQEFDTADSGGDWCLWNGSRSAGHPDVIIEENSHVKLRVRFNGTHGPSEWSNVLEANGGGTQELPGQAQSGEKKPGEDTKDKCALCGFCPEPLGLCIFIWLAIAVAIIVILIVVVLLTKKKKCPNCKAKVKKKDKNCPKCGAAINKN